jgi:ribosomal protein S12 methylthiotransferase
MNRERAGVTLVSLGCPKNLVDSEVMLGRLQQAGLELQADPAAAATIVVNTCGFIDGAKKESIAAILEAVERKKRGEVLRVVVTGCLSQRYGEELRREIPEVDAWLGINGAAEIVGAARGERIGLQVTPPTYLYDHTTPRLRATPPHYAYLKIGEGCDHRCSFCIIPKLRGRQRSRPPQSILQEAAALARQGVRELLLVAQDSTLYGSDRAVHDGLALLLEELAGAETAPDWVRVLYTYPTSITPRFLAALARGGRLVPYVDLPLQHCDREVLRSMQRGGHPEAYLRLLERIRAAVPGVAIRTQFIVGYPSETERRFRRLLDFVAAAGFDHLGVFCYSHEPGTSAGELRDRVSAAEKQRRRRELLRLQQRLALQRHRAMVGEKRTVLVDGAHPESEHLLAARLPTQAPEIDGRVIVNDGVAAPGELVTVEITEAHPYDLVGRIVG